LTRLTLASISVITGCLWHCGSTSSEAHSSGLQRGIVTSTKPVGMSSIVLLHHTNFPSIPVRLHTVATCDSAIFIVMHDCWQLSTLPLLWGEKCTAEE